jgi:hypothetical protein
MRIAIEKTHARGFPFSFAGLNFHCFTAFNADAVSSSSNVFTTLAAQTVPESLITV